MDRPTVEKFIHTNFAGISQDYPWADEPLYTVFRHADNRKWFALIMRVPCRLLGLDRPSDIDIINLKADPDLIEHLTTTIPGFLPAYHMSKTHWLSILLDGSVPADHIIAQIDMSYRLTSKH